MGAQSLVEFLDFGKLGLFVFFGEKRKHRRESYVRDFCAVGHQGSRWCWLRFMLDTEAIYSQDARRIAPWSPRHGPKKSPYGEVKTPGLKILPFFSSGT